MLFSVRGDGKWRTVGPIFSRGGQKITLTRWLCSESELLSIIHVFIRCIPSQMLHICSHAYLMLTTFSGYSVHSAIASKRCLS